MSGLPPEVLAELQKEYLSGFPQHLTDIKNTFEKRDWAALREIFHKFAGSGTTYGLPSITIVGRALETYLDKSKNPSEKEMDAGIKLFEKVVKDYMATTLPETNTQIK